MMRNQYKVNSKALINEQPRTTQEHLQNWCWTVKINAALKLLTTNHDNGILHVDDNVLKELQVKHPEPTTVKEHALLCGPINSVLE